MELAKTGVTYALWACAVLVSVVVVQSFSTYNAVGVDVVQDDELWYPGKPSSQHFIREEVYSHFRKLWFVELLWLFVVTEIQ